MQIDDTVLLYNCMWIGLSMPNLKIFKSMKLLCWLQLDYKKKTNLVLLQKVAMHTQWWNSTLTLIKTEHEKIGCFFFKFQIFLSYSTPIKTKFWTGIFTEYLYLDRQLIQKNIV